MKLDERDLAVRIAMSAFKNKTDKGGLPYIGHLQRVAETFQDDDLLFVVAILHDLLEDCPEWNETSLRALFSEDIVNKIVVLTKKDNENYFEYIDRIKQCRWATKVKIADLIDNMDITRLKTITEEDVNRLNKYLKAYKILIHELKN